MMERKKPEYLQIQKKRPRAESGRKESIVSAASENSVEANPDPLFPYYCGICGKMAVILKGQLDKLPRRRTDKRYFARVDNHPIYSTVIDEVKLMAKSYLHREHQIVIKRKYGSLY